jgi:aminomethyltransferase
VARTGYTGVVGFEIFIENGRAAELWRTLLEAGRPSGLLPVGLGARDTLRLEAGMPLYGNDLDRSTNPFEAGQGRVVKLDKPGDFVGRGALEKIARDGVSRRLVGLIVKGRGIARHGYPVYRPGEERQSGVVTSGTQSPSLGVPIGMAYVPTADGEAGTMVDVGIREQRVPAQVVALPFYRRAR